MGFKYKVSKKKAAAYAQKMDDIDTFCYKNNISRSCSLDSYYFNIGKKSYRISNHTIAASDQGCFNKSGQKIRESYHEKQPELVCITAGKTRIKEIYSDLKNGYELDKRGYRL